LVLFSGGQRAPDADVLTRAEAAMAGGATGVIFGRNIRQREPDDALRFVPALRDVLSRAGERRPDGTAAV